MERTGRKRTSGIDIKGVKLIKIELSYPHVKHGNGVALFFIK